MLIGALIEVCLLNGRGTPQSSWEGGTMDGKRSAVEQIGERRAWDCPARPRGTVLPLSVLDVLLSTPMPRSLRLECCEMTAWRSIDFAKLNKSASPRLP